MTVEVPRAREGFADRPARASVLTRIELLPQLWKRVLLTVWDSFGWLVALVLFAVIRYDFQLAGPQWGWALAYTFAAMLLCLALGLLTHLYLGRSRVGSFAEASWLAGLVLVVGLPLGLLMTLLVPDFPRGVALFVPPMALLFMGFGRWLVRVMSGTRARPVAAHTTPALVYGAGAAGHQIARLVDTAPEPPYSIVGFIDDDKSKSRLRVEGHRVVGTGEDLLDRAQELGAACVILAISSASPALIKQVSTRCRAAGLQLIVVPPVREMISGQISLGTLREFNVADLLGRRPIRTDVSSIAAYITGKRVLVTGAGGSIGAELARQLHVMGPSSLILLDRDESGLHSTQLSIYNTGLLDTDDMVLCDIRDYDSLREIFEIHKPQVVFHAAALKHLPMLERFPGEGWRTNVMGTLNVLRCAHEVGVEQLVNISTDKAADASSILGQTKRLAERLTAWYAQRHGCAFLSVRFGNVLGSRGSVLFSFRSQIEHGGPVTVTHPDVTRYFMTIPEACELVLQAGAIGDPGAVLVLDMGQPVKILDVAKTMIADSGRDDIEIHFSGLREGEKMHEVLFSNGERGQKTRHSLISEVSVPAIDPAELPRGNPPKALALLRAQATVADEDTIQ